jgi:hypothetical protein
MQTKNINTSINATDDVSLAFTTYYGVADYDRTLWCCDRKENVAVITKAVFRLLKNNANNSSYTSENHIIQC